MSSTGRTYLPIQHCPRLAAMRQRATGTAAEENAIKLVCAVAMTPDQLAAADPALLCDSNLIRVIHEHNKQHDTRVELLSDRVEIALDIEDDHVQVIASVDVIDPNA